MGQNYIGILALSVLCAAPWTFSWFFLFVFLLLCLVEHLAGEEGAGCFAVCVLYVLNCLYFLLGSLVGYIL